MDIIKKWPLGSDDQKSNESLSVLVHNKFYFKVIYNFSQL